MKLSYMHQQALLFITACGAVGSLLGFIYGLVVPGKGERR